ncbi:anhydro-N-acetylmuramic acid kinase [Colwellia sp. 1_MG-2023]|jgi:anhydro-N-acetylmuramic acid kinase|uniref:anhydro-N-acetylmuramic acid kinase n=1 Tax=unclassified Colwellia TaxID=196834 RepID=UPI001C0A4A2E|nr:MULTISPECIES: anhydro-N-acetylmuramic acid kinase [unclassified Colwellia]MBU2924040.1 anhydro-N-acetylmuramic acid kinase [Colwellia sp. C2M11]MDO6651930.1 anhydro-N-acetylmuramic acid kinase [Colwellia sp. 3_MG-2023]MDO6664706.1 anhydro-N-acetylmuramic acid kinase [Colwellia sp. 2_MG-2023]MDO6689252.1 anhydro-N-acetylmuramic acid kinase [Colwellia sp. 1_MG-2023]
MKINTKLSTSNAPTYYIGLMSGTSADGIDLALVSFDQNNLLKHHASYYQAYSNETAEKIQSLYNPTNNEIDRAFALDVELAKLFAAAVNNFLIQQQLNYSDIIAIGNHGQTIRHRPLITHPFTLQIGCNQTLATLTNIRVIGQFRRKDMALGGQGAPLVPAFHQTIFSERQSSDNGADVFVVNIGGIANLTFLPATDKQEVCGYDSGPGNALMDDWFSLHNPHSKTKYDENGNWARKGQINAELLTLFLSDNYFQLPHPKSTGREYFHLSWLKRQLTNFTHISNEDVQATLTALTAITIVDAIKQHSPNNEASTKIYLCGGGAHNKILKDTIDKQLALHYKNYKLLLTNQKDIDGDQLEAIAFAWLAFAYDKKLLSSMSTVTGASKCCTLGNEYLP